MSTIKSSDEHLTLNADGTSKDIKFQANGVEKASISSAGAFTSTTIDATKLTGNLPAINGSALTNISHNGTFTNDLTIDDSSSTPTINFRESDGTLKMKIGFGTTTGDLAEWNVSPAKDIAFVQNSTTNLTIKSDGRGLSQFTAKSWVNFNGTGTVAIRDSHNVSSITDNGTGQYRINYSNAMANTSYCPTIGNTADNLGNGDNRWLLNITGISTSYLDVAGVITANGFTYTDKSHCLVTVFGD